MLYIHFACIFFIDCIIVLYKIHTVGVFLNDKISYLYLNAVRFQPNNTKRTSNHLHRNCSHKIADPVDTSLTGQEGTKKTNIIILMYGVGSPYR